MTKASGNRLVGILLAGVLAGCAGDSVGKGAAAQEPVFYPLPPEKPRLQFLASFSGSKDIVEPPSALAVFLTGQQAPSQELIKCWGIAFREGSLLVCDTRAKAIAKLDLRERTFEYFKSEGDARLLKPLSIRFGPDGERYVADQGRRGVVVTKADGTFLRFLGDPETLKPGGLAISQDHVFVSNLKEHRVEVYDRSSGDLLKTFGQKGKKLEDFYWPVGLACDPEGNVLVTDMINCRVTRYSPSGELLQHFGQVGTSFGSFGRPKGIACDREGRIFVVDATFQNVQIFNPEGQLLMFFGDPGRGDGDLTMPAEICIDYDHADLFQDRVAPGYRIEFLIAITSQFGPRKISVYGFLQPEE